MLHGACRTLATIPGTAILSLPPAAISQRQYSTLLEGGWLAALYIEGHYDLENEARIEGGYIRLPEGLGLGVQRDEILFGAPLASV